MKYMIVFFLFITNIFPEKICGQIDQCNRADSLYTNQEFLKSLQLYSQCYEQDTTVKKFLSSMAACHYMLGDHQKAKEYYHQLERVYNFATDANIKLAAIYDSQQNLPKAIKYNIILSKAFPQNPTYFRKLGAMYQQGNEPTQARQSYTSALRINPRDLLSVQGLADMMLSLDELQTADSLLISGLEIDSTHIGLSFLQARVKYRLRDYVSVAQILYKLTYQTELNNYYNKLLGYAFLQIDSTDKSIYHLQKSLLNEGDPEYAQFYLALAYEKKKEYDKADYFFKEAIKSGISDNMDQYYRGLARLNTQKEDYKTVIENYKSSLQYSKDASIYFYMANAAEQLYKDKSRAIQYYQQYLNAKPTDKTQIETAKLRIRILKEHRFMKGTEE